MAATEADLSVKLSLSSSIYHFSNPDPPVVALTVESHLDRPITLFTWRTPFHPASALSSRGFVITDTANNTTIPQGVALIQRTPISRVRGSHDEKYFLTLYPHIPTVVSAKFGPGGMRPEPRAIMERGWMRDEQGNELKICRDTKGCGVDGLEAGHRYRVDVARGALMGLWWRWGTKDDGDILVDHRGPDWDLTSLPPEQAPLDVGPIDGVEFDVED